MKLKHWMCLTAAFSLAALTPATFAQAPAAPQESPPLVPAGDIPAPPAGKSEPKKTELKKKAPEKKPAAKSKKAPDKPSGKDKAGAEATKPRSLTAGPAVANEKNVNLRGQAAINSEIVTRIRRGEIVEVLEETTLKDPKTDEPSRWAKVALPPGTVVWVNTLFIDPSSKAVLAKRLNVRSGPGENFSILGRIDKGYVVKEVETKGDWMKIEAPTNAYAFIAAHLLSTDPALLGPALAKAHPPAPPVTPPPSETATITPPTAPPPAQPLALARPAPAPPPAAPPPPSLSPVVAAPPPPPTETAVAPAIPPAAPDEPPAKRIVTREGVVKGSASIQAPTYFVLRNLENNRTINYLYSPETNILIREFQLQRVLVTGEEILDERWPNTPVITVEAIQAVP
jgi:uncharacterized protein YgiM (DUF1202 family)